jgi:CelD/BcsL family acetyltransferase involved in cellulose biosynthesis
MAAALTSRLWLDAMPVVKNNDDVLLAQFIERLIEHAQAAGDVVVEVGSFASIAGETPLRSLGFALTRRFEFELDLSASEDSLWNGMEYKRRKNIRKAERSGLVIEDLEREEGVVSLRRLQGASSERIVARGGTDITFKGEEDDDPVAMLLDSGVARIVGARLDGEVISAGLFSHFNGLVYHTLSGHNETALATQAPTLLLWKTILRYRAEGAGRFNFGGCPASAADEGDPSHGVYVYKMGFGGRRLECFSGRRVLRRFAYGTVRGLKRLLGR